MARSKNQLLSYGAYAIVALVIYLFVWPRLKPSLAAALKSAQPGVAGGGGGQSVTGKPATALQPSTPASKANPQGSSGAGAGATKPASGAPRQGSLSASAIQKFFGMAPDPTTQPTTAFYDNYIPTPAPDATVQESANFYDNFIPSVAPDPTIEAITSFWDNFIASFAPDPTSQDASFSESFIPTPAPDPTNVDFGVGTIDYETGYDPSFDYSYDTQAGYGFAY